MLKQPIIASWDGSKDVCR